MQRDYRPSPDSLIFRSNLARLISPLRRVRPRVPFYQLAAHTIPTLWSLYRGLLKEAPTEDIKFRVRTVFREQRHLTGTNETKKYLLRGYKFLEAFKRANAGDDRQRLILQRYSQLIGAKSEKEYWKHLARRELAWQIRLRNRPILTGGLLRPSSSNPPLPRLKPQPLAITRMIGKRRATREKRMRTLAVLQEVAGDFRREAEFEEGLAKHAGRDFQFTPVFGGHTQEWLEPIRKQREEILRRLQLDEARERMVFPSDMLDAIKAARREKIANKTRELARERRGQILRRTILRKRKGPPAHILARMSPEQRMMDKITRSVSEVGYVAQVKRKLGFTLRDPNTWKVEHGDPDHKARLDQMSREVHEENERRMKGQTA